MERARLPRRLLGLRDGRLPYEVRVALKNRDLVPLSRQMSAWRRGFYAESSVLYDFAAHGFDAYVSDFYHATRLPTINGTRYLLDDKVTFALYIGRLGAPTPVVHGFAEGGRTVFFDPDVSERGLAWLLEQKGRLVVKPRNGSGGSNFSLLDHSGGTPRVNGRPGADLHDVLASGRLLVSDFVEQHDYARGIFPGSTNTVRLLTLTDPETGVPFLAAAVHRFGTHHSGPVDNVDKGGLSCGVDRQTGVLGPAAAEPLHTATGGGPVVWHENHPDTGAQIAGVTLPHWKTVTGEVERLASALPASHYVGWDVVVTADGFSILEANNRPAVSLFQIHEPLLLDPRVADFFRRRRHGPRRV